MRLSVGHPLRRLATQQVLNMRGSDPMRAHTMYWIVICAAAPAAVSADDGDPDRGAHAFRQCAACHSVELGRHLTGPSLAQVAGRRAATADGFRRYSDALAQSGLIWDRETLDRWLANPSALVPGTSMRVAPLENPVLRRDIIAYLEAVAQRPGSRPEDDATSGGMMGHGGRSGMPDLKQVPRNQRVTGIDYCPDAYRVTLATGKTYTFWEFNLRFKSDSSDSGPPPGQPAIVGQGMRGDRAQIVFAHPSEISAYIHTQCADK